jgi:GNAT superfamily N-acetyltransferase
VAPLTTMLTEAFAADPVHRWLLPTERERRWGSRRAFEAILRQGLRPPAPHWYLFVLGVHPAHQGRGLSAALMDPVLALCDTTCTPAYLESSNEKNLPVYGRRGFQVRREVPLGAHGPSLWPMDRPPRG